MNFRNRLRRFLDARLQPSYMTVVASAIIAFALILFIFAFVTSRRNQTQFGIPLGADFAGFYVAAEILNQGHPKQLYDRTLHHKRYHELLPDEDRRVAIPYVHPPFVAGCFQPLARLPYPIAVAIWMVISASLYVAGTLLVLRSLQWPASNRHTLILLLACSFEPFAFECWLGGQLSAIGYFSFALCFAALQRSRPICAGIALGLCFYKPTLLLLVLPMLVFGRRWSMLLGMTITGLGLALMSILFVGWDVNFGYLNELISFSKSTSGGDLEIRTWKYVDLNNCLRPLLGSHPSLRTPVWAAMAVIPFVFLIRAWGRSDRRNESYRTWLWATTLTWTPVLNLYFGIYDSVLVVQSLLIMAALLFSHSKTVAPLTQSGLGYLCLLIYIAPWFSQNLAAISGVPVYTMLLIGLGLYQFGWLSERRSTELANETSGPT